MQQQFTVQLEKAEQALLFAVIYFTVISNFVKIRFKDPDQAMQYFAKKRFSKGKGVTQPCQKRYIYYFFEILQSYLNSKPIYSPTLKFLTEIRIRDLPDITKENICHPFIEIFDVKSDKLIYTDIDENSQERTYHKLKQSQLNEIIIHI